MEKKHGILLKNIALNGNVRPGERQPSKLRESETAAKTERMCENEQIRYDE